MNASSPKVFVSYSWTSPAHKERVRTLVDRLIDHGVHAIFDDYDVKEGQDLNAFMEQMVLDPSVTKVLAICDKTYSEKANNRRGGVGTESQIISAEVYKKTDQNKFIALVFETAENGDPYLPVFFKSRLYIDMSSPEKESANYEQLIRAIYEIPLHKRPALGKPPAFLLEDEQVPVKTRHQLRAVKEAVQNSKPYVKATIREYFDRFSEALEDFRIKEPFDKSLDELVSDNVANFLPPRDNFIELVDFLVKYTDIADTIQDIRTFFEDASKYLHRPPTMSSWNDTWSDNYRFILYELFLYTAAILIKNGKFSALNSLLAQEYYISNDHRGSSFEGFAWFHGYTKLLQEVRSQKLQRASVTADLLKERATTKSATFDEIMQADFVLFLYSLLHSNSFRLWFPFSLVYAGYGRVFPLFSKAESKRYFTDLKTIFGVASKEEFLSKYQEGDSRYNLGGKIKTFATIGSRDIKQLGNFDKLDSRA
ncbi:toll/interleukin-1 receptor domain-containing protein [Archangium violaceum]|uniref:toll/interleukin-1 receptor domain-containing protein n=1 Tax=Archangium violaceum TaxID=83451 RepID=UPI00193C5DA8|nr:toll/interleukin-1 receptor domain-containing protein [Archangium violaceum]QRK04906.1 toll/interleukin-1 receptor domain-containing protein [Archangium violaceum]